MVNKNKSTRRWASIITFMVIMSPLVCASGEEDPPVPDVGGYSTFQEWSFSTDARGPMLPDDGYNNIYGDPRLRVVTTANWDPTQGAWPLTNEIDILIPNRPQSGPDSYKEIWLQLTWKAAELDPFLWDEPFVSINTHPVYNKYEIISHDMGQNENGWTNTVFEIKVWPNPYEEMITLKGDIVVDQVGVDTYCIPEPCTLALVGLGVIFGLKRKRGVRGE